MKVLVITDMFPYPARETSGVFLYNIMRHLRPLGHEFQVAYTVPRAPFLLSKFGKWKKRDQQFPTEYIKEGIRVIFPRYSFSFKLLPPRYFGHSLWFSARSKLKQMVNEFQPDVIWCQTALPNGWAAMKLSNSFKIPYFMGVYGADMNETVHFRGSIPRMREVFKNAAKVVSVSNRIKRELEAYFPEANCKTIHMGFDPEFFRNSTATSLEESTKKPEPNNINVISVCQLRKSKGVEYNIRAFKNLTEKYPELRYNVFGDGPDRNRLENLVKDLNVSDKVIFKGRLHHKDVYTEIQRSDFMSMPSYLEGFGIVYIESMAQGVPAIGCEGQGIADIIENGVNGFLAPPRDSQKLTRIWEKLISDSKFRIRIGNAGKKSVTERLNWNIIASGYDSVIREIA